MKYAPIVPPFVDARNMSANDLEARLAAALRDKHGPGSPVFVEDFDMDSSVVIYRTGEELFSADYSVDNNGVVTLGDSQPVVRRVVYEPVTARVGNREVALNTDIEPDPKQERRCTEMKAKVHNRLAPYRRVATQREDAPRFMPPVPYWEES